VVPVLRCGVLCASLSGITLRGIRDAKEACQPRYNVPMHLFIGFTVSGYLRTVRPGSGGALYADVNIS